MHGIPATAKTFSTKHASKIGIAATAKTFSMKRISGMEYQQLVKPLVEYRTSWCRYKIEFQQLVV